MNQKLFDDAAFLEVDGPTVKGWHKAQLQEILGNQEESYDGRFDKDLLKWIGKPLPKEQMANVLALVSHYPHTEVSVLLYYNTDKQDWHFHVPKQKGSPASVEYNDDDYTPPKGYYFTGTIHTHPNLGAFWSGIDRADQAKKTGLHVVLGLREGKLEDYLVCLAYNGARYDQEKSVVEMPEGDLPEAPQEWLDAVTADFSPAVHDKKEEEKDTSWRSRFNFFEDDCYPVSTYRHDYRSYESSFRGDYPSPFAEFEGAPDPTYVKDVVDSIKEDCSAEEAYLVVQQLLEELGELQLAEEVGAANSTFIEESDSTCPTK